MNLNSTIPVAMAAAFLAEVTMYLSSSSVIGQMLYLVIVAPRAKSVCSFVSLVQTNLGTKSVCDLVTKRSNGFGYTNLDQYRSHKIEEKKQNGCGLYFRIKLHNSGHKSTVLTVPPSYTVPLLCTVPGTALMYCTPFMYW